MNEVSELKKFSKIIEIAAELYESDPKYFIDCFFDLYYQIKKREVVNEKCNNDKDKIKAMWEALNLFKYLATEKNEPSQKAFCIAYRNFNVDPDLFKEVINSFNSYKSAKKTRFKNLF